MNTIKIGKAIAQARKEAGYTQKSLAESLFVSDKAVSKWERGICLPDVSLFSKIAVLLDIDIENLVSEVDDGKNHEWSGVLHIDDVRVDIAGKPLLHYMLAYFMLVGITDIAILTKDKAYVRSLNLEQYGLNISFFRFSSEKTMVIDEKFLLFGVNLTRKLQNCMLMDENVTLFLGDERIPISFFHKGSIENDRSTERKLLARGNIYIPMRTEEEMSAAASFVELYEKYHSNKISDLREISVLRGLI